VINFTTVVSEYMRKAEEEAKIPFHTPTTLNPRQEPPILNE
jgi:hypothetical protein